MPEEYYSLIDLKLVKQAQKLQCQKPKKTENLSEEGLENVYVNTAIVHKNLTRNLQLDVSDKTKEKPILGSLKYKIKKSVRNETKSNESNQNATENKDAVSKTWLVS